MCIMHKVLTGFMLKLDKPNCFLLIIIYAAVVPKSSTLPCYFLENHMRQYEQRKNALNKA